MILRLYSLVNRSLSSEILDHWDFIPLDLAATSFCACVLKLRLSELEDLIQKILLVEDKMQSCLEPWEQAITDLHDLSLVHLLETNFIVLVDLIQDSPIEIAERGLAGELVLCWIAAGAVVDREHLSIVSLLGEIVDVLIS